MSRRNTRSVRSRLEVQSLETRNLLSGDPLPVLLVIADQQDFFYREYNDTRNSILADGIDVVVAATTTNPSTPHGGSGQGSGSGVVVPDIALANVNADDYSAIAFVGGWGSSMYQYSFNDPNLDGTTDNFYSNGNYNGDWNLDDGQIAPQKIIVNNLINRFLADDKYVAGICHGTTVLAWARVDGVSPISGKQVAVPIKDGSPAMFYAGNWYSNGYVNGQYDQAIANGAFPNEFNGQHGDPTTATDDVVVDGRIITGGDDFSAAYFGTVIAERVRANLPTNNAPTDITLTSETILENEAPATGIGDLSSLDPDVADTFTYSMVAGAGSTDNASFSIVNGRLQTVASFDFEAKNTFSIRVRTTDAGGLFFEKAFTIHVNDVNEAPYNLAITNAGIEEAQPIGTVVGTFSATDPDAGDVLAYSLVAGDGSVDNASFTIDGTELKSAVVFDHAAKADYTVRVRVEDTAGLSEERVFNIQISEVNDPPILDNEPTLILPKVARNASEPTGSPVFSLLKYATDDETPATLGLAIIGTTGIGGTWEYSMQAGSWQPIGNVSPSSAFLLESAWLLRFRPDRNETGYAGLSFRAWDGQVGTAGTSIDPATEPVAFSEESEMAWVPVGLRNVRYDSLGRWTLPTIKEDAGRSPASVVRTIMGFLPTQFEGKPKLGLAVIASTGNGEWHVRIQNAWQPLGPVSETNALLLERTEAIRFVPAADWSGEATLTYRAWDVSNGIASTHADVTAHPGFGEESLTAVTEVEAVNDAPLLDTSIARVFSEDPQSVGYLLEGSADIDSTVAGIGITRAKAQGGTWQYRLSSIDPWIDLPRVSKSRALVLDPWSEMRFLPDAGAATALASFEYKAWDGSTGGLSGERMNAKSTAFSRATETATFSRGNHSPTFVAGDDPMFRSIAGKTRPVSLPLAGILKRMTDEDPRALKGLAVTGMSGNGTWEFTTDGGRTWQAIGDVSSASLLLSSRDRVRFIPDAGWTGTATLEFAAWDRTTGVSGDRLDNPSDSLSVEKLTATLAV